MKRIIPLLLAALLLVGCGKETAVVPDDPWEGYPALTYGVMACEKLAVQPWSSSRCAATSRNVMAETELGYYYGNLDNENLYYADKVNLGNWVRTCIAPNCNHSRMMHCNAHLLSQTFTVHNQRIFSYANANDYRELYPQEQDGFILISRAMDGSDTRLEYALEDAMHSSGTGGGSSSRLTSDYWLYNNTRFLPDGTFEHSSYLVDDSGAHLLGKRITETEEMNIVAPARILLYLFGEDAWVNTTLGSGYYRVVGHEMVPVDLSRVTAVMGYLSGNVVRYYEPNDGYYDLDITTGDTVKLAEARLENAYASVILPNCIVEGTLLSGFSTRERQEGMTHRLELFDGERWHTLALPPELEHAKKNVMIYVCAVASDRILFECRGTDETPLFYQVMLGQEELKLERCTDTRK